MGAIGRVQGEGGTRVSIIIFCFKYTSAQGWGPCAALGGTEGLRSDSARVP